MVPKVENKIMLVQFLDLLALSLLMPAVPPTILKSGGTLMHLGFLMSISSAVRMISSKICGELLKISEKRLLLKYSLIISCSLNFLLFFTTSHLGIMLNRVLFVFFNQVPHLASLVDQKKDENQSALKNPMAQKLVAGLSGCAMVGYLIDSVGGFYVLVLLATAISGLAATLAMQEQPPEKEKQKQPGSSEVLGVLKKTFHSTIKDIQDIDIHFGNWDALCIHSLLGINAKVVFILFVVLVIFVFQGKGSLVNAIAAYQTIVLCCSGIAFYKINLKVNNLASPKEILEKSLIVCTVCAFLQSFAPSYSFYMLMFIPFVLSRTFVEHYFKEVFETSKNQKLALDLATLTKINEIVAPLFIGLLFQLFKHNAYRLLTVTPFIAIYYIVSKKSYKEVKPENISESKNNEVETDKDK